MDTKEWIVIGILVTILSITAWASIESANQWIEFKEAHHCKVVSKESDSVALANTSDGKIGTVYIQGKTGYLCDDGVTYYR